MPVISLIIQAALFALLAIFVIFFIVLSSLLTGKRRDDNISDDLHEAGIIPEIEGEEMAGEMPTAPVERPIWEKYPQIYRFEILYWRGVSRPWWWNNYAEDLVKYAGEYFPWNKVNYYCTYNSNSVGEDYKDRQYHDRIVALRPHKASKHPLVVINYGEEYIMVDNHVALEEIKDRIDAEWLRHYGTKITYRNSPTTY
ncbi:MAG: hypothetical protein ABI758_03845 [Candidatus Woesebacteria bacterium]